MLLALNLMTESFKGNDSFRLDLALLQVKEYPILGKNGDKYLLCNGCVSFFKNIKNKEMAGIKDIEKVR